MSTTTILTILLIVAAVLLVAVAGYASYEYNKLSKKNEDLREQNRKLIADGNHYMRQGETDKGVPSGARTAEPHEHQPSPEHTRNGRDVRHEVEARNASPASNNSEVYFPLSQGNLFLNKHVTCRSNSVYEAQEVAQGRYEFTIISAEKAKSWDIGDAVNVVGTVLQKDAVDFTCISKGEVIEREDDDHNPYWEITKKAQVEFTK